MMVEQKTDMIASVLEKAFDLSLGAPYDSRAQVVLFHGDPNELDQIDWTGPFEPEDVKKHIDMEMLAGAMIVFADYQPFTLDKGKFDRSSM